MSSLPMPSKAPKTPIPKQLTALRRAIDKNDADKASELLVTLDRTIIEKQSIDRSRDGVLATLLTAERSFETDPDIKGKVQTVRDNISALDVERAHIGEFVDVLRKHPESKLSIEVLTGERDAIKKRGFTKLRNKGELKLVASQVFSTEIGHFVDFADDQEQAIKLLIHLNIYPDELVEGVLLDQLMEKLNAFKPNNLRSARTRKPKLAKKKSSKKKTTKKKAAKRRSRSAELEPTLIIKGRSDVK